MGAFFSLVEHHRKGEGICEDEGLSLGGMGCSKLSGLLENFYMPIELDLTFYSNFLAFGQCVF